MHVRGQLANRPPKLTLWVIERAPRFVEHWRALGVAQSET
jgi:hypothetical protein